MIRLLSLCCLTAAVLAAPAPASAQTPVSVRRLQVDGPVSRARVQQALERALPAMRRCLGERATAAQGLSGEMHVRVYVAADGAALAAAVDWENIGDRPAQRCVTRPAQTWEFREHGRPTTITFRVRVGRGDPSGGGRDVRGSIEDGPSTEPPVDERPPRASLTEVGGSLVLPAGRDVDAVHAEFTRRLDGLSRCVERGARPFRDRGEIHIRWQVRPDGRVTGRPEVSVSGGLPEAVGACIARYARRFRFPAAGEGATDAVRVEVRFTVDWSRG